MAPSARRRATTLATAALCAVLAASPVVAQASPAAGTSSSHAAVAAQGSITYTINRSANPSSDEQDAYSRITTAMDAAVARYNSLSHLSKNLVVNYNPGTPTADGNYNGTVNFGSDRQYMTECTALHEIAHAMGVGQSGGWYDLTNGGGYHGANATALIKTFDGQNAVINTGGGHFWPYGLNYNSEFSDTAADRHVQLVQAMVDDGM